ncbi:MAG: hypothetical protein KDD35_10470 [Bdellovibrionales bacterium]|nr:hypothetical protein [Bdellovibrionales bacterium]
MRNWHMKLSATFVVTFLWATAFASGGVPLEHHGSYIGISPLMVSGGASHKESLISFRVEPSGLFWATHIGGKDFEIFYPNSWLLNAGESQLLRDWAPKDSQSVWAIRQNEDSELAQIVIGFSTAEIGSTRIQATALVGEGTPVPLGFFIREEGSKTADKPNQSLALFEELRTDGQGETEGIGAEQASSLAELDSDAASIMVSKDVSEKLVVIKKAGLNLWTGTGTDTEIDERIKLIELGLNHSSPVVQGEALGALAFGGRVTDGVAIIANFLDNVLQSKRMIQSEVVDNAVYLALVLLYESHRHLAKAAKIVSRFGSTDVEQIHRNTGGIVNAADADAFNFLGEYRSPKREWTIEHFRELRRVLELVSNSKEEAFSESAKSIALGGLSDFSEKPLLGSSPCRGQLVSE